eukprot:CAMPEP_0172535384 /NCGR_PEP_ID=MMETSP1067-20121228/7420_1 /TAXON_ID=265564 ORGANISM="Thalassiosira punctigera, Strain Tpunct2005C2" /NCGR_SAMPLE_ID=MMETSP1067 /ASSEMBLY_ACC=CAM_ASM_000444 /LENGTH=441 /DNA_ID=CAMNT_0013320317 /DNA_START=150 /DNA_END=1475 /DNA_ORIENTATION=+
MMSSNIKSVIFFIAVGVLSFASADAGGETLDLYEFQKVLRTGLDSELTKIVDGSQSNTREADQREIHTKRRYNVRRRTANRDSYEQLDLLSSSSSSPSYSAEHEHVWDDLLDFAWKTAEAVKRDEQRLSVTSNPAEAHPCPFLICTRGRKDPSSDNDGSVQDIMKMFDKRNDESLLLSSSHNETCLILTTTALQAQQVMESHEGSHHLVVMPLLDITKIHAGTIDEVVSPGWSVPFVDQSEQLKLSSDMQEKKNETDAINEWERMIVVDFVPGLGGMKEEAELLEVVNNMMADIQDMGEVGWLRSLDKEEAEEFVIDESLVGVPALSDMFSLTSSLRSVVNDNARISFWRNSLKNGIESEHACSEMFTTLFVKPRAGYFSYDLVMNPSDGPPPQDYESSASNPACVTSLIAAISTHPYVLSVKANFPIYHGWHVAHKLDSF